MDNHNPYHVNLRVDEFGDFYDDCDNIIQVFMDVNIAVFWVVISYRLVGVLQRFGELTSTVRLALKMGVHILSKRRNVGIHLQDCTKVQTRR